MIYERVNFKDFCDAFHRIGRSDSFSYEAKRAIFDYLEELSEDEDIELDVISICCDFREEKIKALCKEYDCEDFDELTGRLSLVLELDDGETIVCCE